MKTLRTACALLGTCLCAAIAIGCPLFSGTPDTPTKMERDGQGSRPFLTDAWRYCRDVEEHSAKTSGWWAGLGIPTLAAGLPTAAAGTTLTIAESTRSEVNEKRLAAALGLAAGGYLLSFFGIFALDRSAAGANASAEAGRGLAKDTSSEAYKSCIEARATWLSSRERAIEDVKAERDHYRMLLEQVPVHDGGAGVADAKPDA